MTLLHGALSASLSKGLRYGGHMLIALSGVEAPGRGEFSAAHHVPTASH